MKLPVLCAPLSLLFIDGGGCMGKTCNAIGCWDSVSITVRRPDGQRLGLSVTLEIDGQTVNCPPPDEIRGFFCPDSTPQVSVRDWEVRHCWEERHGNAVTQKCLGTGRFEQVISISGRPARVRASLTEGDVLVAERDFEPSYRGSEPAGEGCGYCYQATEEWELP